MPLPPNDARPGGPGPAEALVGLAVVALCALLIGFLLWSLTGAPLPRLPFLD